MVRESGLAFSLPDPRSLKSDPFLQLTRRLLLSIEETMRSFIRIIIFLLTSFVAAASCLGETLIISNRSALTISADRIRVEIFTENRGSEPAYRVQAHLYIFGRRYSADAVDQLGVNQSRLFQFVLPLPPEQKGEFPFVGEILYHDAGGLPVSALCADTFKLGSPGGTLLSGRAPEITLPANENLSVQIGSRDSAPREVLVTLYLPTSLKTPQNQKRIRLKPIETAGVDFPLTVRHGTGDATYPVFCILTYRDGGVAHAAVIQTIVHVKDFQNWFVRTRWYWLGAGGLIVLGWAWLGVRAGKRS
jgi:hypothetical protein